MMDEESESPSRMGAHGRADERTRFKKGQVGNPEGRNQYTYRRKFEAAFATAVERDTDALVSILLAMAKSGQMDALRMVVERLVPKIDRHELDAGAAPTKIVLEFAKPTKEGTDGDAGRGEGDPDERP